MMKGSMIEELMYRCGQRPGEGRYACANCGEAINLRDNDHMPPCAYCGNIEFRKT